MGGPPSEAGACQVRVTWALPPVAARFCGAEGGEFGGGGGGEFESFQAVKGWSSQWYGPSQKTNPCTSREMLPFDCSWPSVSLLHDGTFGPQWPFPNQSRSIPMIMYPLVVPTVMLCPGVVQEA